MCADHYLVRVDRMIIPQKSRKLIYTKLFEGNQYFFSFWLHVFVSFHCAYVWLRSARNASKTACYSMKTTAAVYFFFFFCFVFFLFFFFF